MRNSTIRTKFGECPLCSNGKEVALTKGLCNSHYWLGVRMKSMQKQEANELSKDEDLQTLVNDLDIIFSRYIRLKEADLYGIIECYCCGDKINWKYADAMHFIPRAHMYTRFMEENVHSGCQKCNRFKDGELALYAKHLEKDRPGTVESLQEHSHIVYKYDRTELKSLISYYSRKLKLLQK